MYYFDYLRVRRSLGVFATILLCVSILLCLSLLFSKAGQHGVSVGATSDSPVPGSARGIAMLHELGENMWFPFGLLCGIAITIAIIFSASLATSLSRYNGNLHFSFTKPVSREQAAITTFAFDFAAIVIGFLIALFFVLVPFAEVGLLNRISFGPTSLAPIASGLGIAFMWYALIQAVTAQMRSGGGLVLGLSWGVFGAFSGLQNLTNDQVPVAVVYLIHAFNVINPFMYLKINFNGFDSATGHEDALGPHYLQSLATVWIVALVALAIAVVQRKRMEV
jgi:hypothetical protein